jgi:hypothetical protein
MNEDASNCSFGPFPDLPEKLTEEEMEQVRDMIWAATDPEVSQQYPDEVVAAYRRKIIAHGDNEEAVLNEAERLTGLPRHKIAVTTVLGPELLFARDR